MKKMAFLENALWVSVLVTGLSGCGGEPESSSSSSAATSGIPLPQQLRQLPSTVTATASIDELSRSVDLQIIGDTAIGTFDAMPSSGDYTVTVRFTSTDYDVALAQTSQTVTMEGGSTHLQISADSYDFPDDDGDNYSNLDEILVSNAPTNGNDYPSPQKVFITSVEGRGDLSQWSNAGGKSGLEAGDQICQTRANQAGLEGLYRAWLSDQENDAYCRAAGLSGKKGSLSCDTQGARLGPYIRTDGFPVAETLDQWLNDGQMFSPIQVDEFGNSLAGKYSYAWTATNIDGTYLPEVGDCGGWDSESTDLIGGYGQGDGGSYEWTETWKAPCGGESAARLYCFQVGGGDPVLPLYKTREAKKVFATSIIGSGDFSSWEKNGGKTGRQAADNVCQTLAGEAGYENPDKFTAWLTDSNETAADWMQGEGPWARPDGVVVAHNRAELLSGTLFSPISQTEKGAYIRDAVWTGTQIDGRCPDCSPEIQCNDWSSSSESLLGKRGHTNKTFQNWTDGDEEWTQSCDQETRLYCFEQ